MRALTALASILVLVSQAGCTALLDEDAPESFEAAFKRMQDQPDFLWSRAHPEIQIVETFSSEDDAVQHTRVIPCGLREMHDAGWRALPAGGHLTQAGTSYSLPAYAGPDEVVVMLGREESEADARYEFRAVDGKWHLSRMEIYSYLEPGSAVPALPCNPPAA